MGSSGYVNLNHCTTKPPWHIEHITYVGVKSVCKCACPIRGVTRIRVHVCVAQFAHGPVIEIQQVENIVHCNNITH